MAQAATQKIAGLKRRGWEVEVFTSPLPNGSPRPVVDGVPVQTFCFTGRGAFGSPFRGEIAEYRQAVRTSKANVIITEGWEHPFSELLATEKQQVPLVHVSHSTSSLYQTPGFGGIFRRLAWQKYVWELPKKLKTVDHIVFLTTQTDHTRFYDRFVAEKIGITHFSTIPNGSDLTEFAQVSRDAKKRYGLEGKKVIILVGNFQPGKNQGALLEMVERMGDPAVEVLLLSGFESDYGDRLRERFRHLSNVRYLVALPREELLALHYAADLFVQTSINECQPLVLLDAMAAGLPFLALNVGCCRELPGGKVVQTLAELEEELPKLLNDPVERERYRILGLEAASTTYNWETVCDRFDALLRSVVSQNHRP
jgi:glycosyltransferase involved in cell wall biosynthesis